MAKKESIHKKEETAFKQPVSKKHPEAQGLIILLLVFISTLAVISFDINNRSTNWLGIIGHYYAWGLMYGFGLSTYLLLGFTTWIGWKLLIDGHLPRVKQKIIYLLICTFSLSILFSLISEKGIPIPASLRHKIITETTVLQLPFPRYSVRYNLGGVPSYYLYRDLTHFNLQHMLSDVGVSITFSLISLIALLFLTEIQILSFLQKLRAQKFDHQDLTPLLSETISQNLSKPIPNPFSPPILKPEVRIRTAQEKEDKPEKKSSFIKAPLLKSSGYDLPPLSLLTNGKKVDQPLLKKELRKQAELLEETLLSFNIEAKVGDINCGPTITSFEVHPAVGVKVQKITALENDIALNLQAKSLRIIAPIPGKAAIGIEIPSPYPQEVSFKEMLQSYQQGPKKLQMPIILGKTVTGDNVIADLTKMPHCLIAGATGSGKSVCINTMIMSMLMIKTPDELKLIMIDPKRVELTPYSNLPHLIAPVITEPHGAYAALNWLVKEMQSRYEILKQLGLRNISSFNSRAVNPEFESSLSISIPQSMPIIVGIIDEFADLMMASSSDLETPIARIAQMARAVGIHLILATQRPSREVITGLIKANLPTCIAFKVSNNTNSQIILGEKGAENLVGNGDMLYSSSDSSHIIRAQGSYIRDEDINRVIQYICNQASPNYLISSFDKMNKDLLEDTDASPKDALYSQAEAIVIETQVASTTFLQRKLKIGYARAASLMDELEDHGVISAQEGSKPRRVLIKSKNGTTDRKTAS